MPASPENTKKIRILVVGESPQTRQGLEALSGRFSVCRTEDGLEALELAEAFVPDVVLVHLMIKGLDAIEVCARLRQILPPTARIIAVSNTVFIEPLRAACLRGGAGDVIFLPATWKEIAAALQGNVDALPEHREFQPSFQKVS